MQHKLENNQLIHGDILEPKCVIATFNDAFLPEYRKELVVILNYGDEFIKLYESIRNNQNIRNISFMVDEMEKLYSSYFIEMKKIRNSGK